MMIDRVNDFLEWLTPHFISTYVGCYENGDGGLYTGIDMDYWDKWEDPVPVAVVPVKALAWFGYGWFPRPIGDPIEFDEWERRCG